MRFFNPVCWENIQGMFNPNITPNMEAQATQTVTRSNLDRFMTSTGKGVKEYQQWATQTGRLMHINTLDRMICASLGIYTVAHLPQLPTPLPEGVETIEQETSFLLEHSRNPLEVARIWQRLRMDDQMYLSIETVLAEYLQPFPKANFEQFGDPNHLPDVSRSWFKKKGTELDVQIEQINEIAPLQVTIQDAIDFVKSWKPGSYESPVAWQLRKSEEVFQALTTFRIKDYYAEHLLKMGQLSHPALTETVPF